jgi:hypothetical protein
VSAFGHPERVDAEKFRLITPYDSGPRTWLKKEWIDQHSKKRFRVTQRKAITVQGRPLALKRTLML